MDPAGMTTVVAAALNPLVEEITPRRCVSTPPAPGWRV
jgi:hypothetical protein